VLLFLIAVPSRFFDQAETKRKTARRFGLAFHLAADLRTCRERVRAFYPAMRINYQINDRR